MTHILYEFIETNIVKIGINSKLMVDILKLMKEKLNAKQSALIVTAFELFSRHGFQRVSVDEICTTAQVSKVTFYRYFKSKDVLILKIIRSLMDDIAIRMKKIMESDLSIKEKFDKILIAKQEFVPEIGEELTKSILRYPPAEPYITKIKQDLWQVLIDVIKSEQEQGNINPSLSVEKSVKFMIEISNLYNDKKLDHIYGSFKEMVYQVNELLVYGLLSRN